MEREVADLLAGRQPPDARRLLRLIHDVNPTGRLLDPAETRARYALKASLQSVLIRTFRDDLRIEPVERDERTIGVSHRYLRVDACHAVIDELDPDAQAWVRWQLDTHDTEAPSPVADARSAPARRERTGALHLGRAALAAYDFESARHHFEHALDDSPAAAAGLMELLVDHLGDDEAALRLAARLDARSLGQVEVRTRIGLAHARCTQPRAAEAIARTLPPPRAAEIYVALGRAALRDEDAASLRRALAAAREADPSRAELSSLADGLARVEASERATHERVLLELREAEDREALERQARTILSRWPESESARRALRELRAREAALARAGHLATAEQAITAERVAEARAAIDAARALGADVTALEARLALAREAALARRDHARVERVAGMLAGADLERALGEYIDLDEPLRARVQAAAPLAVLGWLDQIVAGSRRARTSACVAAALALGRALEAEARGERNPAALAPHERLLAGCTAAVELARRSAEARREEQRLAQRGHIAEARASLAAGDAIGALRRLDRISARELDPAYAAEADALRRDGEAALARSARVEALARCEAEGANLAARGHARWLTERSAGAERERWLEVDARLTAKGRAQRRWRQTEGGSPDAFLASRVERNHEAEVWLDASGERIAHLSVVHDWLFIDEIDVGRGRSERCVSMRLPAVVGSYQSSLVDDAVYVASDRGFLLVLDRREWDVLAWCTDDAVLPRGAKVLHRYIAPDGRRVWYLTESERRGRATMVIDVKTWAVEREIRGSHWVRAIPGPARAMCFFDRVSQRGELLGADEVALGTLALEAGRTFHCLVEHPRGGGFLALRSALESSDGMSAELSLGVIQADGRIDDVLALAPLGRRVSFTAVTSRAAGCVFVLFDDAASARTLVAIDASGAGYAELYRVQVPARTTLLHDCGAERVVAATDGCGCVDLVALGREAPRALRGGAVCSVRDTPDAASPFACQDVDDSTIEEATRARLVRMVKDEGALVRRWVHATMQDKLEPDRLVGFIRLFTAIDEDATALKVANLCAEHLPVAPSLTLLQADLHTRFNGWREALEHLSTIQEDDWPPHAWHIAGSAHLYLGDVTAAERCWRRGVALGPSECGMDLCLALLDDAPGGLDTPQALTRDLVAAIRRADERMAAGDSDGALAALDRPSTFVCGDAQAHARLTLACLSRAPRTDREALFYRCVFAELVRQCQNDKLMSLGDVLVPGAVWDAARIRAVRDRALAYLDAEPG